MTQIVENIWRNKSNKFSTLSGSASSTNLSVAENDNRPHSRRYTPVLNVPMKYNGSVV